VTDVPLLRAGLVTVVAGAVLSLGTLALPEPPPGSDDVVVEVSAP
jgi:hypothetical protein